MMQAVTSLVGSTCQPGKRKKRGTGSGKEELGHGPVSVLGRSAAPQPFLFFLVKTIFPFSVLFETFCT
jgi:hypothetical protein